MADLQKDVVLIFQMLSVSVRERRVTKNKCTKKGNDSCHRGVVRSETAISHLL